MIDWNCQLSRKKSFFWKCIAQTTLPAHVHQPIKYFMMWITTGAALLKPSLLSHCLLITFNFLTILYCQGRIILDLDTAASDVSDISEHTTGDFYRRWFVFYLDNFPLKPTFKFLHIVLICHPSMVWFSVNKSKPEVLLGVKKFMLLCKIDIRAETRVELILILDHTY